VGRLDERQMGMDFLDLGDLLVIVALFFSIMIVIFECAERRRESRRERRLLDAIEREYEAYFQIGHVS
jgi:sensor c-di-GMP phosphodiesterase-like protein